MSLGPYIFGSPGLWVSMSLGLWVLGSLGLWVSRFWVSMSLGLNVFGSLCLWISRSLGLWISGSLPGLWVFRSRLAIANCLKVRTEFYSSHKILYIRFRYPHYSLLVNYIVKCLVLICIVTEMSEAV